MKQHRIWKEISKKNIKKHLGKNWKDSQKLQQKKYTTKHIRKAHEDHGELLYKVNDIK